MKNEDSHPSRAGVIDVGSNTIKILAGERTAEGMKILFDQTAECRISEGMYSEPPRFTEVAMDQSALAIRGLLEQTRGLGLETIQVLSTSAVRDAENRKEFTQKVVEQTGLPLAILSGEEEAQGIANGIAQEPAVNAMAPYTVSDLGGGSLEWIFRNHGRIEKITSMQLGAVRMLNRCLPDATAPVSPSAKEAIRSHCLETFRRHLPADPLPTDCMHWGTGGAFTITRLLLATEKGISLKEQSQRIPIDEIQRIEATLSALPLAERQNYPGLPPTRADILPVALIIIQALAEFSRAQAFHHSFCNLRMGRLASLLGIL